MARGLLLGLGYAATGTSVITPDFLFCRTSKRVPGLIAARTNEILPYFFALDVAWDPAVTYALVTVLPPLR